ncbi:MAG TPA: MliC family protein [Candidatus Binatia bacterium]
MRAAALVAVLASSVHAGGKAPPKVVFGCEGDVEVVAVFLPGDPGSARVESKGETWTLPHVPSGSGAKYSNGAVTFWTKGKEALFDAPGSSLTCTAKP